MLLYFCKLLKEHIEDGIQNGHQNKTKFLLFLYMIGVK